MGTHDNNTAIGWWENEVNDTAKQLASEYLRQTIEEPNWDMMHCGMSSVARTFVATMQDLLALGSEARMNTPGTEQGNWSWRLSDHYDHLPCGNQLRRMTWLTRRLPEQQTQSYGDKTTN